MDKQARDDPLHKLHCLACRGICVNCANLTHSHEDGAAYCKDSGGWWITVMIRDCETFKPLDGDPESVER